MSGIIVPLLTKTRIERSYLGASASETTIVRKAIPVGKFYKVHLLVRVHERNLSGGAMISKVSLVLYKTLPSSEDPREFSLGTSFLTVDVLSSSPAPGLLMGSATEPGAYLKFAIVASQSNPAGPLYAEISAVAVLREN